MQYVLRKVGMKSCAGASGFASPPPSASVIGSTALDTSRGQNEIAATAKAVVATRAANGGVFTLGSLQSRERAGADAETIRLDPEALQHAEVEIAELRAAQTAFWIGLELAVLESS